MQASGLPGLLTRSALAVAPPRLAGTSGAVPSTGVDWQPPPLPLQRAEPGRARLHELHPSLHCSVIGTCFGLRELRQLVVKFADPALARAGDHTVHTEAVRRACRRDGLGKELGKALDRKFKATITRYAAAKDAPTLRALWVEALKRGDAPDAYWAVLTHPAVSPELVREAFGDIHMLSHLVGAANRADIRRLQALEAENAALEDRLARQQRHLTLTLGAKEQRIRALTAQLAAQDGEPTPKVAEDGLAQALRRETDRRLQLERHVEALQARLAAACAPRPPAAPPDEVLPAELPACCAHEEAPPPAALGGSTILLVGGRPAQAPALARAVATAGGTLLHHDGGTEMSLSLLPGLVSRADRVVLALDSVSHAAAGAARRCARGCGKRLVPLPNLSLTSLARALDAP